MTDTEPTPEALPKRKLSEAEREYAGLRIFLSDDVGFRLAIARFDRPATRDGLMERITEDLSRSSVCLTALDVGGDEAGPSLLSRVQRHLEDVPTPAGQRRALAVVRLEERLKYPGVAAALGEAPKEELTFLENANLHRDAFPAACPCPLLLWLTAPAETALARNAPDLWHWRSARFDFEGEGCDLADFRAHPAQRIAWFEKIAAAAHRLGDRRGETGDLLELGIAQWESHDTQSAVRSYEAALTLARETGDRRNEGAALGNLGVVWSDLGEHRKAIEFFEQHLVIARAMSDRHGEGASLGNLGIVWSKLGESRKAIEFYAQHLAIARETADRRSEGRVLYNLGLSQWEIGQRLEAIASLQASLVLYQQTEDPGESSVRTALDRRRAMLAADAPSPP